MSVSQEDVINYLVDVPSLKDIDNHEVRDSEGSKTGQMPATINLGKELIDEILEDDEEQEKLSEQEINAVLSLRDALDTIPISFSFTSIMSAMNLDVIQKNLLESVEDYLANVTQFEEHKLLLKAVVLVLKILEYDLSKKSGPIEKGFGLFKMTILSNEQRIENHAIVKELLNGTINRFDKYYESETLNSR